MMSKIRIPLFLSFYVLIFLAVPAYGNAFQLLSLALIVMQNIATFISLRRNKFNTFKHNKTLLAIFLIAIIPLQSLFNNFFNLEIYYVEYSILFLVSVFSIYIAVNTIEFRVIFNSFLWAAIAITLTILFTNADLLSEALSVTYDPVNGLNRFVPFGLHPNLVGHIFGGFAILFFCSMLHGKNLTHKMFFTALMLLSLVYCVAASSRGGFLGAVIGIGTIYAIVVWKDKGKRKYLLLPLALALLAALSTQGAAKLLTYLASIFEYSSGDRGVDSGLTGRTASWDKLLNTVFSSVTAMLLGNGLRTGGEDVLGYDIDNSYLNLLYEMGLPATVFFVLLVLATTNKLRRSLLQASDVLKAVAVGLLVFILCESVVARYLLSIGNPLSLFVLYCMLGARNILKSPFNAAVIKQETYYETLRKRYKTVLHGTRLG